MCSSYAFLGRAASSAWVRGDTYADHIARLAKRHALRAALLARLFYTRRALRIEQRSGRSRLGAFELALCVQTQQRRRALARFAAARTALG